MVLLLSFHLSSTSLELPPSYFTWIVGEGKKEQWGKTVPAGREVGSVVSKHHETIFHAHQNAKSVLEREAHVSLEPQMTPLYSGLLEALQESTGGEEVERFTRCFGGFFRKRFEMCRR